MKYFLPIALSFYLLSFASCTKDCPNNQTATCMETVPNEACQAYFVRWFYNIKSNKCEQIGYSGCSEKGFATESECLECQCN